MASLQFRSRVGDSAATQEEGVEDCNGRNSTKDREMRGCWLGYWYVWMARQTKRPCQLNKVTLSRWVAELILILTSKVCDLVSVSMQANVEQQENH
jgi:hypothetical protein